jgi:uncharacterized PurR-regulated membrane protein YhhQ (DUF165 family)
MFPATLYIANVVLCNWLFAVVPMIDLGLFGMLSPVAALVGFTFVLRDYAQRSIGHYVILCMIVACLISFYMADPYVALASATAFAVSEVADYLLYTLTKRPFHQRVLLSSAVSTPVDTVVFLWWINALTPATVVLMIAAKLLAAVGIWLYYEHKSVAGYTTA